MSTARSNRLPMVLAGVLLGITLLVVIIVWLAGSQSSLTMRGVPVAPAPDADSPATVLRTLSAQVEETRSSNAQLSADNTQLQKSLDQLSRDLRQLRNDRPASPPPDRLPLIDTMRRELGNLRNEINRLRPPTARPVSDPLALGPSNEADIIWIEPLDADAARPTPNVPTGLQPVGFDTLIAQSATASGAPLASRAPAALTALTNVANTTTLNGAPAPTTVTSPAPPPVAAAIPVYTIPSESTLLGSTAWTALLGRIPVGGQVPDPWRFKVLTGRHNLAANGLRIPGLTGMIWSGTAVGDLALRCVSGKLTSVTFVFQDGRIVSHRGQGNEPLGYLSDDSGIPCVPGELKTNAPQWLGTRAVLAALEAGAGAFADDELTRTVGPLGDERSTVTGDAGRYALGEALRGGAQDARRWVDQRQRQSFDAIFVAPGRRLTLHIETEIPIDYDPNGRKIRYGYRAGTPYRTATLD